ncbi:MrcB family domain-containing protein [Maricaulis sp.]|uniref:MrcB family domain-containing protein n=1 Tax=Maricaulis sp. TaxID=1486257 RepID=UPI003A8FB3A9
MRDEFQEWVSTYPSDRAAGLGKKSGTRSYEAITKAVPTALEGQITSRDQYLVEGNAGSGNWPAVSWVGIYDVGLTSSGRNGYYLTYLLSADGKRLVLSLQQGCSDLHDELGRKGARAELQSRARLMQHRLPADLGRLTKKPINLAVKPGEKLGPLYEAGHVFGRSYRASALPEDSELKEDFRRALHAYGALLAAGGYTPIEDIVRDATIDGLENEALTQQKRYVLHKTVERNPSHARKVKAHFKTDICMGCYESMTEKYGDLGKTLLEAHHLIALNTLATGQWVSYRVTDFALLCPSCHRAIHKIGPSELNSLRDLVGK